MLVDGVAVASAATSVAAATQLSLTITVATPAGGAGSSRTFVRGADRYIAIGLDAKKFLDGKTVGFIIHGAVGSGPIVCSTDELGRTTWRQ